MPIDTMRFLLSVSHSQQLVRRASIVRLSLCTHTLQNSVQAVYRHRPKLTLNTTAESAAQKPKNDSGSQPPGLDRSAHDTPPSRQAPTKGKRPIRPSCSHSLGRNKSRNSRHNTTTVYLREAAIRSHCKSRLSPKHFHPLCHNKAPRALPNNQRDFLNAPAGLRLLGLMWQKKLWGICWNSLVLA